MADKTQQVTWTVLPNGLAASGRRLRLSVHVGPALTLTPGFEPRALSEFEDFLDWPRILGEAKFALRMGNATLDLDLVSLPESEVWGAIFPKDTAVSPSAFEDLRGTEVLSYPVSAVHDHLREIYAELAAGAADARPTISTLRRSARPILERPDPRQTLDMLRDGAGGTLEQDVRGAFALLDAYHAPLEAPKIAGYTKKGPLDPRENATWMTRELSELPDESDFKTLIDFHQIVSAMDEHRGLLRALGLVLDFEAPADAAPADTAPQPVQLLVRWPASPVSATGVETLPDRTPITQAVFDGRRFFAAPSPHSPGLWSRRLLPLGDERFRLLQLDVDGSAVKWRNLAANLLRMRTQAMEEDVSGERGEARLGVPALRSGGLTLVETRRARRLRAAFERMGDLHDTASGGTDPDLFADDLARGVHVDILDETVGRWRSLCRRDATYFLLNSGETRVEEDQEGTVRLGAVGSTDGSNPDIVKLHEAMLSWSGWSLAAPPIGRAIDIDSEAPEDLENDAPDGLPLEIAHEVAKGSLPSLRFGRSYRMRARVVDLALNALPHDEGDLPGQREGDVSTAQVYRRFEPVESPAVALVAGTGGVETPQSGESMARIAIRSFNATPELDTEPTDQIARRHVYPPCATVKLCETHGALDGPDGRLDPATFGLITARDDDLPRLVLTAPDSGLPVPDPDDEEATRSLPRFTYAAEGFALPHLPDPLAAGVRARIAGAAFPSGGADLAVDYYPEGRWPDALPFELVLGEGPEPVMKFDPATRRLHVALPKAETARLRLSHVLTDGALDSLAIWHWLEGAAAPGLVASLKQPVMEGRHWMLTPDRELRLYHAVQKPLITPEFLALFADREVRGTFKGSVTGDTAATIAGRTPQHPKSTEKIDLYGRWNEAVDAPTEPAPEVRHATGLAADRRLHRLAPELDSFSHRHEFGDSRYRRVIYRMDATTRFREFMPEAIRNDPAALSVSSAERTAWVPNGSTPPAPHVLYVVPTFGWTRTARSDGQRRSFRDGGGIRVYLARPWLVSGAAEMLAVVLPPAGATSADVEGPLKPLVSQWGGDPIFGPGRPQTIAPPPAAFPLRRMAGPLPAGTLAPGVLPDEENDLPAGPFQTQGLTAPGLPEGATVNAVPHAVGWDATRGLWFCDIVIDPGAAYGPFVRLALARYQPVSVEGAHLSAITQADFIQLTPDRLLTVTPRGRLSWEVALYGVHYDQHGGAPATIAGGAGPLVTVTAQEPSGETNDELGWRDIAGATTAEGPRETFAVIGDLPLFAARQPVVTPAPAGPTPARSPVRQPVRGGTAPGGGTPPGEELLTRARDLVLARNFPALLAQDDLFAQLAPPLIWRGQVAVPTPPAGGRLRLLVSEFERWTVDPETLSSTRPGDPDPQRRLVYAEAVEIEIGSGALPLTS